MKRFLDALLLLLLIAGLVVLRHEPAASAEELAAADQAGAEPDPDDDALEDFVPSERLPADSVISFPVDI